MSVISNQHQANASETSNVPNSVIQNSNIRNGFQFIFSTANSFIDSIKINIPNEIFPLTASTITIEDLEKNFENYFKSKDSTVYFNKVTIKLFNFSNSFNVDSIVLVVWH